MFVWDMLLPMHHPGSVELQAAEYMESSSNKVAEILKLFPLCQIARYHAARLTRLDTNMHATAWPPARTVIHHTTGDKFLVHRALSA